MKMLIRPEYIAQWANAQSMGCNADSAWLAGGLGGLGFKSQSCPTARVIFHFMSGFSML